MKAMVIIPGLQGGSLEWCEVPRPELKPGQLLLRVKTTALNRGEWLQNSAEAAERKRCC